MTEMAGIAVQRARELAMERKAGELAENPEPVVTTLEDLAARVKALEEQVAPLTMQAPPVVSADEAAADA